jgi:hypothetical protein
MIGERFDSCEVREVRVLISDAELTCGQIKVL